MSNKATVDQDYVLNITLEDGSRRWLFIQKGAIVDSGWPPFSKEDKITDHLTITISDDPLDNQEFKERLQALGYKTGHLDD